MDGVMQILFNVFGWSIRIANFGMFKGAKIKHAFQIQLNGFRLYSWTFLIWKIK